MKRTIYTAGVWDLIHTGHLNILRKSKALGDTLIVGVVSDDGTEAYKGRPPIQNQTTRKAVVEALDCVDFAVIQPTTDPSPILEAIQPDVMTHGDDWDRLKLGQETVERLGIEWVLIPYTPEISTTQLRGRIEDGRLKVPV